MFKRAERKKAKLRLALCAPSGAGKTYSALLIAQGLGGSIAMIDTERGSGELYSHLCAYDACQVEPPYTPQKYIEAIRFAERAGYTTIIIDSLTHAWAGQGGLLEEVDKRKGRGNDFTAWRDITPQHNALVDAMLQSSCHIIGTMRTKTAYDMVKDDRTGKVKPVKVGLAPVQRDGLEYEFTVVMDIDTERHMATASKDRTSLFDGKVFVPTVDTGRALLEWLEGGKPAPEQKQVDMHEVETAFFSATTESDLKQAATTLGVGKGHPQRAAVEAAYRQRLAEIQGAQQAATSGAAQEQPHA
ncbi:ATP-binding protein [Oleidesulfovibrio sp.]|uniref:ATP-binding protein n=1 Tax=Oleidesulfovibrio sp. TaxID=2909707 RepID=UPI003A8803F1